MPLDTNALDRAVANNLAQPTPLDDPAFLASVNAPTLTPKRNPVTWASLNAAKVWGISVTAAFRANLTNAINQGGALGAACVEVKAMLDGGGFDPSDPQTPAVAGQMVALGFCSQANADKAVYDIAYPLGDVTTTDDLAASKSRVTRQASIDAIRGRVTSAYAGFLNERVNPAEGDPTKPVPTWDDFLADVARA